MAKQNIQEENDYKIGLDIGNSGFKIVGAIDGNYIFYNIKALANDTAAESTDKVQMSKVEKPIHFGVGLPLVTQNKTERLYMKETLFLAACKVYGSKINGRHVKIGIGLPLEDFKNESLKETFMQKMREITHLEGEYNDEYYTFDMEIQIFAEGFSAFYYLMPQLDKRYRWLIVDHGYRTTDAMLVSYINNKWFVENYKTVYRGLVEVYEAIDKAFTFNTNEPHYPAEEIEFYLTNKMPVILKNPYEDVKTHEIVSEIDLEQYIDAASTTIKHIYDSGLNIKFGASMDGRKIMLVGGGAEIANRLLAKNNKTMPEKAEERVYANALGIYLQIK